MGADDHGLGEERRERDDDVVPGGARVLHDDLVQRRIGLPAEVVKRGDLDEGKREDRDHCLGQPQHRPAVIGRLTIRLMPVPGACCKPGCGGWGGARTH